MLPRGFVKIRHYGLWASGNATTRLDTARACLLSEGESPSPTPAPTATLSLDWRTRLLALTGIDLSLCPGCGGLLVRRLLSATRPVIRPRVLLDTS